MIMYNGGMIVAKGLYWSPFDGGRVDMSESGVLPGSQSSSYLKISPVVLLAVAPFLGMTFLFFLPLLGIGVLFVLCLFPALGLFSAVTSIALRVCSERTEKQVHASRRVFIGSYKPSSASFTGAARKKKAVTKSK